MLGLVIEARVFLQQPAQSHRAGNEQQISGDDYHNYRHKEQTQGHDGVFNGDGQKVGPG